MNDVTQAPAEVKKPKFCEKSADGTTVKFAFGMVL